MSKTNKADTAASAYSQKRIDIVKTMNKVRRLINRHEPPPCGLHWGHVGDLANVLAKLEEIAVFLNDEEA